MVVETKTVDESVVDDYLKVGLHIGTKYRTKSMKDFIFKVRSDGLAVLDVQKINVRLDLAAKILSNYNPEDVVVVCRRENGWYPVKIFSKLTGIRAYTGRYPPGILTNTKLEDFIEIKLLFVVDPFPDRNVINDAAKIGVPVIALCDTNNEISNVDFVVPCNNKGKKSLGLIFLKIAKEYLKLKGIIKKDEDFKLTLDDFAPE
ncbi:30S ribosomal protein S2 [Candidatus Woesearchaeota archaeon]|nr:30S ribosomal protein S2 [Candidatus Woesearchaeota archaeon]